MNNTHEESNLRDWVNSQGFPLEMRVASIFKKEGFEVQQSHFFPDPEDGTYREIDLVCSLFRHKLLLSVVVNFVVECKVASKYPWVLFTSEDVISGYNLNFVYGAMNSQTRERLVGFSFRDLNFDERIPNFKKNGKIGFALVEGLKKGEDTAFKAIISSVKASIAYSQRHSKDLPLPEIDISFPVIVVDGSLYECNLDEQGDTKIQKIKSGYIFQPRKIQGFLSPCITVVSGASVVDFAKSQAAMMGPFLDQLIDFLETPRNDNA